VFANNPYITGINPTQQRYDAVYNLDLAYENNPKIHAIHAYRWSVYGNVEMNSYDMELFPSEEDKAKIKALDYKNFIVAHWRQHTWPSRNLRPAFYQELAEKIINRTDLTIIQVGSYREVAVTGHPQLVDARGKFTIQELKILIDYARAFISVDGGLTHVGGCSYTPQLAFFTSCKAEYRKPFKPGYKFFPIEANIDCYGCQEDNPPPCTQFICRKGNVPCIDTFDADHVISLLKNAIA
jgi:ADP-heptose:LPS heptosyltransferase